MRIDGDTIYYVFFGVFITLVLLAVFVCITDLNAVGIVTASGDAAMERAWRAGLAFLAYTFGLKLGKRSVR